MKYTLILLVLILSGCKTLQSYSPAHIIDTTAQYGCVIDSVMADGERNKTSIQCKDPQPKGN